MSPARSKSKRNFSAAAKRSSACTLVMRRLRRTHRLIAPITPTSGIRPLNSIFEVRLLCDRMSPYDDKDRSRQFDMYGERLFLLLSELGRCTQDADLRAR